MFFFYNSKWGCLGSIVASVVLSLLVIVLLRSLSAL
jgi:hypothetical protein